MVGNDVAVVAAPDAAPAAPTQIHVVVMTTTGGSLALKCAPVDRPHAMIEARAFMAKACKNGAYRISDEHEDGAMRRAWGESADTTWWYFDFTCEDD